MAKQRVVNTYFWSDDFILDLKADEKLLFLYVLTNPQTDLCGAYQIAMRKIVFETGLTEKRILAILEKFESAGKVCYRNGWMMVRNFTKHQVNNPKVKQGIERSLNGCPDWVKDTLLRGFDSLSKGVTLLLLPELEPIPIGKTEEMPPSATNAKKGSRIPDEFLLTAEMRTWAAEKKPGVDLVLETEKFCNYWRAKSGKDATKLDWRLTWNNWILNAKSNGTDQKSNTNNSRPTAGSIIANRPYRTDPTG
jgi:hypothetical protein